jgi:hypothetical protein
MDEFVQHLVCLAKEHQLYPLRPTDLTEVYANQNSPSQRAIFRNTDGIPDPKNVTQSFIKKETYPEPKDPRPISTINGNVKLKYSSFIYAIQALMKKTKWYAFGKTPDQIRNRMMEMLSKALVFLDTDFSRMDGNVDEILREFEEKLVVLFGPEFRAEFIELQSKNKNLRGFTTHGVEYETKNARASGSAETSCFNTLASCFTAYLAFRKSGYSKEEAWERLGQYGGDDGGTPDGNPKQYESAAKMVGQVLKVNTINRGERVTFLGRVYSPDVWYGNEDNCIDTPRMLQKFHLTTALGNTTRQARYIEKLNSLFVTDSQHYLFAHLFDAATRAGWTFQMDKLDPNNYWAAQATSLNKLSDPTWVKIYCEDVLGKEYCDEFIKYCNSCNTFEQLMNFPELANCRSDVSAVEPVTIVNDHTVVPANDHVIPVENPTNSTNKSVLTSSRTDVLRTTRGNQTTQTKERKIPDSKRLEKAKPKNDGKALKSKVAPRKTFKPKSVGKGETHN